MDAASSADGGGFPPGGPLRGVGRALRIESLLLLSGGVGLRARARISALEGLPHPGAIRSLGCATCGPPCSSRGCGRCFDARPVSARSPGALSATVAQLLLVRGRCARCDARELEDAPL